MSTKLTLSLAVGQSCPVMRLLFDDGEATAKEMSDLGVAAKERSDLGGVTKEEMARGRFTRLIIFFSFFEFE